MREALYSPRIAAYIPFVIDRAYRSNYVPLGKLVNLWSEILTQAQDTGANLSYNCAESNAVHVESSWRLRRRVRSPAICAFAHSSTPARSGTCVRCRRASTIRFGANAPVLIVSGSDESRDAASLRRRGVAVSPQRKRSPRARSRARSRNEMRRLLDRCSSCAKATQKDSDVSDCQRFLCTASLRDVDGRLSGNLTR